MVLNAGYEQQLPIERFHNNAIYLQKPLRHHDALADLQIEYVIFPTCVLPLGITADAGIEIGIGKENLYTPPTIKPFATLEAEQLLLMHTQQVQKIFFQSTGPVTITWGEHYII